MTFRVLGWIMAGTMLAEAGLPDFEKEVAPLLEAKCLACHDAARRKGDFDLSTRASALSHGTALVPGDPLASGMLEQVVGPEPEMPKKEEPLSSAEVGILRRWIAGGAVWPATRVLVENRPRDLDWWSLRPIPKTKGPVRVDEHIDRQLASKGLQPAPEADPVALIRRLTYDLTGLPPTPGEVAAFVDEASRDTGAAVAAHADRLMATPAFGEAWARRWLDVARYAETHGYDKDKPRMNAWPYRDYVIRSFNADKPYARFVREQVAGDILYPGTEDGLVALGFLAAGPWDYIGHAEVGEAKLDGRIAKHLDRDEMVSTVFNVFQSTTVQCAQCHHHKFDPVRMEDYYRLHAVFAAVDRADRVYAGLSPEEVRVRSELQKRLDALKAEQTKLKKEGDRVLAARTSGIDRRMAELRGKHGGTLPKQTGYHSALSPKQETLKWVQVDLGKSVRVDRVVLVPAYDDFNDIGAGFGFPLRYRVEVSADPEGKTGNRVVKDATGSDQPNPRNGEVTIDTAGAEFRHIRLTATKLAPRKGDYMLALGELEAFGGPAGENLAKGKAVTALDSIEARPRWSVSNLTDGVIYREVADPVALAEFRSLEGRRAAIEAEVRDPVREARLAELDKLMTDLTAKLGAMPKGKMVYAASTEFAAQGAFRSTGGKPREIRLLHRGDLKAPGDLMVPGAPPLWAGAADAFEATDEGRARAALAGYLTASDNPLFWRSIANRVWQWTFGEGLVGTGNDFGRMGLAPTHPELLDALAAQLRDDPRQSLKAVIRTLVTTRAYRRSSRSLPENERIDANNTALWRANRRRLTAEEYRDSLLAVSGVLRRDDAGGPSFQDFVIEKPQHSPHYEYALHNAEDPASWRRSVYRFIVRSQPQPFLSVLDCADPSQSVARRDESTTALQALAQWNNRLVEVMSRKFADRLAREAGDPVRNACLLAFGRPPSPEEDATLRAHFREFGPASLARVIFNLNAFVYLD
ncbi:MAG: DUF1549 domain-containing protein [Verrucomicrobia bacterium]|nr:DUF1549 domain-containing protein [Verrucomicrobiota bacterium]